MTKEMQHDDGNRGRFKVVEEFSGRHWILYILSLLTYPYTRRLLTIPWSTYYPRQSWTHSLLITRERKTRSDLQTL
jgi:hypothetical protein